MALVYVSEGVDEQVHPFKWKHIRGVHENRGFAVAQPWMRRGRQNPRELGDGVRDKCRRRGVQPAPSDGVLLNARRRRNEPVGEAIAYFGCPLVVSPVACV